MYGMYAKKEKRKVNRKPKSDRDSRLGHRSWCIVRMESLRSRWTRGRRRVQYEEEIRLYREGHLFYQFVGGNLRSLPLHG